jgi:hypothetical protein
LLVLIGILVILVSIFLPYVSKVRESNRRTRCAENLYAIGLALTQYAKANSLDYPRVRAATAPAPAPAATQPATQPATTNPVTLGPPALVPQVTPAAPTTLPTTSPSPDATGAAPPTVATTGPSTAPAVPPAPAPNVPEVVVPGYTAFTGADSPNPFAPDSRVQPNDVTASLWLLARSGLVEPYRFVCPSTGHTPDPMTTDSRRVNADQRSNFTGPGHLSYSYSSPFSGSPRFRLNYDVLTADFAMVADKSPGTNGADRDVTAPSYDARPLDLARANSANHDQAGQNVLYPTGDVQFQKTPYCGYGTGWQRDNIYTAFARSPLPAGAKPAPEAKGYFGRDLGPAWEDDSYLVPAEP